MGNQTDNTRNQNADRNDGQQDDQIKRTPQEQNKDGGQNAKAGGQQDNQKTQQR